METSLPTWSSSLGTSSHPTRRAPESPTAGSKGPHSDATPGSTGVLGDQLHRRALTQFRRYPLSQAEMELADSGGILGGNLNEGAAFEYEVAPVFQWGGHRTEAPGHHLPFEHLERVASNRHPTSATPSGQASHLAGADVSAEGLTEQGGE